MLRMDGQNPRCGVKDAANSPVCCLPNEITLLRASDADVPRSRTQCPAHRATSRDARVFQAQTRT